MKLYSAPAKVNIFLKITGKRDDYHEIISRFVRVDSLCDTMSFVKKNRPGFSIEGAFDCGLEDNTIYKAYIHLRTYLQSSIILQKLIDSYAIRVEKCIPAYAGLGGGSSNAATFLKMCNEVLHLGLTNSTLAKIGAKVGADVPFFIYGYKSANVSGIGEIVEEFIEEPFEVDIVTPKVKISTPKVYKSYRENFFAPIDANEASRLAKLSSKEVLSMLSADEANDLFKPAMQEYKELKSHYVHGWFFSGSGSSFFKIKE